MDYEFSVLLPTDPSANCNGFLLGVETGSEIWTPGLFYTPTAIGMGNDMMRARLLGHGYNLGQTAECCSPIIVLYWEWNVSSRVDCQGLIGIVTCSLCHSTWRRITALRTVSSLRMAATMATFRVLPLSHSRA